MNDILEKEAREYFSHNPQEKSVAFVMLDSYQIKLIENDESIFLTEDDFIHRIDRNE